MKPMTNRRMIRILFRKEMKDIFRDRKSVLMMFFVPVVLYPLIFFVAFFVLSIMQTGVGVQTYRIVLDDMPDTRLEQQLVTEQREENDKKNPYGLQVFSKDDYDALVSDAFAESDNGADRNGESTKKFKNNRSREMIATLLKNEWIDVYVNYSHDEYHVFFNSSVTNSQTASTKVSDALMSVKQKMIVESIEEKGLDAEKILNPFSEKEEDTATSEQSLGFFLGTIIPFMMIISLLVGVFTPAIDATTGEKERGTLETLLMMPVTNSQIIVAKFLSVALVGLITTLLSVLSMAGLGVYLLDMITSMSDMTLGGIDVSTFVPAILITLPVLITLSLFLTSICMCVTCFAKSYKEANTYMSPVMIIVMLTGYIGFIPNIELSKTVAMIPIANVCLLIKNLLLFKVNLELVLIVIASTAVYTGLVILLLGKMYRSEAILFDEGRNGLALLERRSNMKKGGIPTSGDGWFVALVGFLLLMYVGGLLQANYGMEGLAVSQVLLLLFPLVMAVYTKKNLRLVFSLSVPRSLRSFAGSLLFGLGAISLALVTTSIVYRIFPSEGELVSSSISEFLDGPGLWLWIVVAVFPAICEEALFRGYILAAFRSRYHPAAAILLVAVSFGIYHTSPVRFPATALLGGAFAYIVYKTGSIIPASILHCLNNSIAVAVLLAPAWMEEHLPFLMRDVQETGVMLIETAVGLLLVAVGILLLRGQKRHHPDGSGSAF